MATDLEWAWAAGIFEGEGCISHSDREGRPLLRVAMTDFDIVDRFAAIVGGGTRIHHDKRHPDWKDQREWRGAKRVVVQHVLNRILPYLGERRKAKAREALIWYETHSRRGR